MTTHPRLPDPARMQRQSPQAISYRIVVKGRLSHRYGSAFEGLTLEPRTGETAISGVFVDQAQLYGVLDRLRDFGIELVSVNVLD
jgi:hypothetical protein